MKQFGLGKKEKLCSQTAIDALFRGGEGSTCALAYPLRAVAASAVTRSSDAPIAFLISIPKKKLRHAVDRVSMRRRVREAYRLNRLHCPLPEGVRIDVAFIYVADRVKSYRSVERAVIRILETLATRFTPIQSSCDDK